jgi:predicted transcriptional regulator
MYGPLTETEMNHLGITKVELARESKISLSTLGRILRGDINIKPCTLAKVGLALDKLKEERKPLE